MFVWYDFNWLILCHLFEQIYFNKFSWDPSSNKSIDKSDSRSFPIEVPDSQKVLNKV